MNNYMQDTGLYWRPIGGNNIDQISGHCYQYTCVMREESKLKKSSIIVDLGKFDNYQALGIKNSIAAVPDIRELLCNKDLNVKALLLTHSHPDHLNGIVHYLRAGYKLPPLYGGLYTKLILDDLYIHYNIGKTNQPSYIIINDGDKFKCGNINVEVISSSHTCFSCFGFIISDGITSVYHSGDMKIDQTTYFTKPTNTRRLKQLSSNINFVVADFCGINIDGLAYREADVLNTMIKIIKKVRKSKIFLPVYPTHVEMYILAFLTALKLKKDVIFYGNDDFFTYLSLIRKYGIDFDRIAKNRINVFYGIPPNVNELNEGYIIIGTYNDLGNYFDENPKNSFALITARTYFNPLKGQMNARNIPFVTLNDYPILQGAGHGYLRDWEEILKILPNAVYIPTHCPHYVAENFNKLGKFIGFKLISPTPKNNDIFKLSSNEYQLLSRHPANWLVVNEDTSLTEVWQKPTSGIGFLKRTFSRKRTIRNFEMMLCQRIKNKCN